MSAKLKDGQVLRREIHVYGVEAPVIVEITTTGIEAQVKGTRKRIGASWPTLVGAMETPQSVPSYLMGRPIEFLKAQAAKLSTALGK